MLNELNEVRKSLAAGGINFALRHPDIKSPGKKPALKIRLSKDGKVDGIETVPKELAASWWTLRDGQKNSFPNVTFRTEMDSSKNRLPLLELTSEDRNSIEVITKKRGPAAKRSQALLDLIARAPINSAALGNWPGYVEKVQERLTQLASLRKGKAAVVIAVMERFVIAAEEPTVLISSVISGLDAKLRQQPSEDLINIASDVLIAGDASFYFDASEFDQFERDASDPDNIGDISEVLLAQSQENASLGTCCLTGSNPVELVKVKFPQPNLPLLGQTYIFAKNADTPCSYRYERSGTDAISIGRATAVALQGALSAITIGSRENKTWATIPSENPKIKSDLLLAYVATDLDFSITDPLICDLLKEGEFEEKAKRVSDAFRARHFDQRDEPRLRLMVIRKVDTANRKVIYTDEKSVARLLNACDNWLAVCRKVPQVTIPVPVKAGERAKRLTPFVIPPASLVGLTKEQFIRNGEGRTDIIGGRYSEALELFWGSDYARQRAAKLWLRLLLSRRRMLLIGIAQALRLSFSELKKFDARGALATITAFHVVLSELETKGKNYMNDAGFKLGQLLAAADELHCGYCHGVRNGSVPSRLMGNALVPMAEKNPQRALAVLCRRWPIYEAWAKKNAGFTVSKKYTETDGKKFSPEDRKENQKQWAIAKGISACRRAEPIAKILINQLGASSNDEFRAKLILGYIAGPSSKNE